MFISLQQSDDQGDFAPVKLNDMKELCEVVTSENYCLSTFNGRRKKKLFKSATAIALDFDKDYSLEQAKKDFASFKCIIATSRNHQKVKNKIKCDRFRVILFLTEEITTNEVFSATWHKLASRWTHCDVQCKDSSRYYYPSPKIIMVNKKGKKIKPEQPKETPSSGKELKIGEKGKLSKLTRRLLLNGIPEGERNGQLYKIARDFHQNNYPHEEAHETIMKALTDNGTIAYDFTEDEAKATIDSAFSNDPSHGPRQPIKLQNIDDIVKNSPKIEWLVSMLMFVGGVSLISAPPKCGKSTLIRYLIACIIKGWKFLGRRVKQGEVHYYAIEEHASVLKESFQRLGISSSDKLFIHVGDVFSDNRLKDAYTILVERKPALMVIDTLFDFLDVESENNYKEVKIQMRRLRHIARSTGTHIVCVHHSNKSYGQFRGNSSILGSQAISGGVDTILLMDLLDDGKRAITTSGRGIKNWYRRELIWDRETDRYSLGKMIDIDDGF